MKRVSWLGEYDEIVFCRSNLVTFGALIIFVTVVIVIGAGLVDLLTLILPFIFALVGLFFIYNGLFSSSKLAVELAEATLKSDMLFFINILSTPLYWIWMKLRRI